LKEIYIFKSLYKNKRLFPTMRKQHRSKLDLVVMATAIIALGISAITPMSLMSKEAIAVQDGNSRNYDQIPSIETIQLEGLSLDPSRFLELSDTAPVLVQQAHVAINVPCSNGDDPKSDIAVIAAELAPGVEVSDLEPVDLEFIEGLSNPGEHCTFHADISPKEEVTDIAIINLGESTVEFESGNFASVSVSKVKT
jgi:hypothetical protein